MLRSIICYLRKLAFKGLAQQSDLDVLYSQVSGLIQIQNAMLGLPVLRPLRGWAISPDAMEWILADLQGRDGATVVEFGAGQSTIILATALKHRDGRLITIEHDEAYAGSVWRQLRACRLEHYVEMHQVPLIEYQGEVMCVSYDLGVLAEKVADVVLVDGPPSANGLLTRLPPLRWAVSHLKPGGCIFLDDARREGEQACVRRLLREFPTLHLISRCAEKGLVEFRHE